MEVIGLNENNAKIVVVPGEVVTEERKKLGQHVYLHQGRIYSDCLGMARIDGDSASVVPLEGKYVAQAGVVSGSTTTLKAARLIVST